MRNSFILLLLCLTITISGTTYYVSPDGKDSNPGTLIQPFFTLNKAWTVVSAGDIIYMRGGTYNYTSSCNITGKSGTSGNLIKVLNYPGEFPVISGGSNGNASIVVITNTDYVVIKGIRFTNLAQPHNPTSGYYGIILWRNVNHCTFESLETDHIGGWGVVIGDNCSDLLFLNCDSHHNQDPYSNESPSNGNPYGGSDGFESGSNGSGTSTNITFRGCRAWYNSDDGWDLRQADGVYTVDNCWSFWNGYIPGTTNAAGNGEGFKLGGKTAPATSTTLRTIKNSLAFENLRVGISPEPDLPENNLGIEVYNCVSYSNVEGLNFNYTNVSKLRNNISFNNSENVRTGGSCSHDHNSFDLPVTVSNADFISVNSAGVDGPRQADGSLPNISFLHLASGSDLIDAGADVGLPFGGKAPDLGAFETGTGSTVTIPVYVSSAIENATPSLLEMTYNITLANIVPANSSFSVQVNSTARTVNTVAISGAKVKLTLASRIVAGDVVTVSYTKPANNPLQTIAGGTAIGHVNQPVINNCINVAPAAAINSPTINSSFTAPASITITANASDSDGSVSLVEFYNGNTKLGSKSAAPYSFTWTNVAAGTYSITVIAIDNLNAKTSSSAISISVINNTPAVNVPPVVTISNPQKGNKFEKLSTITINAVASDPDGTIIKVEFYSGAVKLVELNSAPYTYTWKNVAAGSFSITAVATDNLNDTTISSPVEFLVAASIKYDANSDIINLYPNPNNGHFSIEFINPLQNDKSVIIITDMAGKQVYNGPVLKEETKKQIDVSNSRSGIYVMMIKDREILVTKKFIKTN